MTEGVAEVDTAWRSFAERIKAVGESIAGEGFPTDPRLRAEGYRYVNRLTNLAHQIFVEFGDPAWPSLVRVGDDTTPFGATNTDNNYYRAMLDPAGIYRVSGDVSGVKELLFSVQDGEFVFGKTAVLAELSLEDLEVGDDCNLELILGGPEQAANWLPLAPDAVYLNVREFVGDWENDALASLYIERLDDVGAVRNLTPTAYADALDRVAAWVEASVKIWKGYVDGLRTFLPVNELQAPHKPVGGADNMLHGAGQWELDHGHALLVEFEQPQVTYWSIQTYVLDWMVPLDFANRVTSLNDRQLHVDDDGIIRVVLSHTDPGIQNWLDTSDLRSGLLTYRYVRPSHSPAPRTRLIEADAPRRHLPESTPVFSAAMRQEQVSARRRGVARRFRR